MRLKSEKYGGLIIRFEKNRQGVFAHIYVKGIKGQEEIVYGATKEQAFEKAKKVIDRYNKGTQYENRFIKKVKQMFPNATEEKIRNYLPDSVDFCWEYGEVSKKNSPDNLHSLIDEINRMAKNINK